MAIPRVPLRYGMKSGVWRTVYVDQTSLAIHCIPDTFCFTTCCVEQNACVQLRQQGCSAGFEANKEVLFRTTVLINALEGVIYGTDFTPDFISVVSIITIT